MYEQKTVTFNLMPALTGNGLYSAYDAEGYNPMYLNQALHKKEVQEVVFLMPNTNVYSISVVTRTALQAKKACEEHGKRWQFIEPAY